MTIAGSFLVPRKSPLKKLERILIKRIGEVSAEKDIGVTQLAGRAGIARSSLWAVMNGHSSPTLDWVQRIADVLEVDPVDLLVGTPARLPRKKAI